MHVRLIAKTQIIEENIEDSVRFRPQPGDHDADFLAETAGRLCYRAFSRSNPATALNRSYLENIQNHQHESVFGHASFSFLIQGVSRAMAMELIRHRFLAFSQVSQRYVAPDAHGVAEHPSLFEYPIQKHYEECLHKYDDVYSNMRKQGFKRKEAREAARHFLPEATATDLVVSGNVRAWRDFLRLRWSDYADKEICELAGRTLEILRAEAPNSFQDIPDKPYATDRGAK